ETWMELGGLAAQRRDRDRVLEQPARVGVMGVGRRRQGAHALAEDSVSDQAIEPRGTTRMRDLGRKEVEEAVELLDLAPRLGDERGGVGLRGLERPHLELQAVAEPLHPAEHADGVSFAEALVEKVDVVPDAGIDPPARIDELEREIRVSSACSQALLAGDGEEAINHAILGELGDHAAILGPGTDGNLARRAAFEAVSGA